MCDVARCPRPRRTCSDERMWCTVFDKAIMRVVIVLRKRVDQKCRDKVRGMYIYIFIFIGRRTAEKLMKYTCNSLPSQQYLMSFLNAPQEYIHDKNRELNYIVQRARILCGAVYQEIAKNRARITSLKVNLMKTPVRYVCRCTFND